MTRDPDLSALSAWSRFFADPHPVEARATVPLPYRFESENVVTIDGSGKAGVGYHKTLALYRVTDRGAE